MQLPTRRIPVESNATLESCLEREWLVTNGMGGYAAGTIVNVPTRRYHGLLIAALPAPLGRIMMLDQVAEEIRLPGGQTIRMGGLERPGGRVEAQDLSCLREFRLEGGFPTWTFELQGFVIEKQLFMPHEQNTVHVNYRVIRGEGHLRLRLRPALHVRAHDQAVDQTPLEPWPLEVLENRYEVVPPPPIPYPRLRLFLYGESGALTLESRRMSEIFYRVEHRRGYPSLGQFWSPGYFRATLSRTHPVTLVASTESWETLLVLPPQEALRATRERMEGLLADAPHDLLEPIAQELILAADQFVITPVGRAEERARARAVGDEVRTVIAGYHWFTDWGRDTMISLEGLTLATGRLEEAGFILRTFGRYVRDGLIPNLFPEGQREGLYHTADATLWYFHALDRYLHYTGDQATLRLLLPTLLAIYDAHLKGTRFGIGVDPSDGLLSQGMEGYQLTWMDAKVADWVVTPRRGKAVEINALWYNALRLLETWLINDHQFPAAEQVGALAAQVQHSFNLRFWNSETEGLFDVIDGPAGDDPTCRPNQILAVSLPHPVLSPERWNTVLGLVQKRLLTPVGLRSLAAQHPDYKPQYFGDLRARDAAYHQGTIWAWLIGPFIDAWMRVHPNDPESAARFLRGFNEHLSQACIGSISEIFDAEAPYHPRGCVAQAWSVAEILRVWLKIESAQRPSSPPGATSKAVSAETASRDAPALS
jgi:predicted glycogen debranching enzyme